MLPFREQGGNVQIPGFITRRVSQWRRDSIARDITAFDRLHLPEPLRSQLRPRTLRLYTRLAYNQHPGFMKAWWTVWAVGAFIIGSISSASSYIQQAAAAALCTMLFIAAADIHRQRGRYGYSWIRPALNSLQLLVFAGFSLIAVSKAGHVTTFAAALGYVAVGATPMALGNLSDGFTINQFQRLHAGDQLAREVLAAMLRLRGDRATWYRATTSIKACKDLTILSNMALYRAGVGPRGATGALAHAEREEATRIAEVFAAHRQRIVHARSPRDYDAVSDSLGHAALALLTGDRAALLANAPAVQSRRARFTGWAKRSMPAFVFLGAGALLLLLPLTAAQHTVADQVSWGLLAVGVTMLLTTNTDVASRIGDAFSRTLGGGK